MMQSLFFEEADQEVEEHRAWYRERSESAESGFLRELDHAIEHITEAPHRWPVYLTGTRRYVFPEYPFFTDLLRRRRRDQRRRRGS